MFPLKNLARKGLSRNFVSYAATDDKVLKVWRSKGMLLQHKNYPRSYQPT